MASRRERGSDICVNDPGFTSVEQETKLVAEIVPPLLRDPNMDALLLDLRQAIRSLRASKGFTLTVVLAVALGVGVTTTMFSAVDQLLIRPLPYPQPDRLVWVFQSDPAKSGIQAMLGQPRVNDLRTAQATGVFESVSIFAGFEFVLSGVGEAQRVSGVRVDSNFFRVMRVRPALGRALAPEEDRPGSAATIVLSDALWRTRFGADAGILGKQIRLDTTSYTVVGVMPAGFNFPHKASFWAPLIPSTVPRLRHCAQCVWGVGRLQDGVSVQAARVRLRGLAATNTADAASVPPFMRTWTGDLMTLRDWATNDARTKLLVLFGAVCCVLLIACANVTNLLLARTMSRRPQFAVRSAIGATRARIVRLVLVESAVLAVPAAAAGVLLSVWGVRLLDAFIPRWATIDAIHVDGRVLLFAVLAATCSALLAAAWPALQASGVPPGVAMRDDDHVSGSIRRNRVRSGVVIAQVATTVVLVIASSLLGKSLIKLLSVDVGFAPERLVIMTVQLTSAGYPNDAARDVFRATLERRLASLPGVRASAVSGGVPFGGLEMMTTFAAAADTSRNVFGPAIHASSAIFDVLGTRLLAGRPFAPGDSDVAIISQSGAVKLFPNENAVGQRLALFGETMTVVGVVADMHFMRRKGEAEPQIYFPIEHAGISYLVATLRTDSDPRAIERKLRGIVRSIDPQQPVTSIATMDQLLADSVKEPRTQAYLLGAFGVLAFVMTCLGVFGVVSYSVTQRTREIGVRVALGADAHSVLSLVVGQGTVLSAAGTVIGIAASFWATRLIRASLYEVNAIDPCVFVATASAILAVTTLASYLPARRAMAIDPVTALRAE